MPKELSVKDLILANEGRVNTLCRCILYGLVEPNVELTPEIQYRVAEAMIEELEYTLEETPSLFFLRSTRALKWAVRKDIPPEFGIFAGVKVMTIAGVDHPLYQTQEYKNFIDLYGEIIRDAIPWFFQ